MADILFKQVRLPDGGPDGLMDSLSDVAVEGGRIVSISPSFNGCAATVIEGAGRLLMPGAIDMHVHLREPGAVFKENIASGSRAAALAGVTTVADMPNNRPPVITAQAFMDKAAIVERTALCDVRLYMALTGDNVDEIVAVSAHPLFAGVKVFLGATTGSLLCGIEDVVRAARQLDCMFLFHAESEAVLNRVAAESGPGTSAADHPVLRPVEAAVQAVRAIAAAWQPGFRFHICHVSTAAELDIISASNGITCEAAPHHMALDTTQVQRLQNRSKMNPPLRDPSDREAVLQALLDGRISCVATDHAPHTLEEKAAPYPSAPAGVPGLDTLVPWVMSLVGSGLMSPAKAAQITSENPAGLLGLHDRGRISTGLRADMYLTDPCATWNVRDSDVRSKCAWTPFDGMTLGARPEVVCIAGKIITQD